MKQSPLGLAVAAIAILLVGTGAGIGIGYARWHEPFDRYANARRIVMHRAEDFPRGGILLLGDSNAERLYLPELCGKPVFNAGISGARADQIAPIAKPLIEKLSPATVIVIAGTNDRIQGDPWTDDLVEIAPRGAVVVDTPADLAQERGWLRVEPIPKSLLMADGIHPSAEGRRELKRRIVAAVCSQVQTTD